MAIKISTLKQVLGSLDDSLETNIESISIKDGMFDIETIPEFTEMMDSQAKKEQQHWFDDWTKNIGQCKE